MFKLKRNEIIELYFVVNKMMKIKKFWFVNYGNSWFVRGADFPLGTESGVFALESFEGKSWLPNSFR